MQKHKIITIITTFNKAQCKRFIQFLRSPYHNPSEKVASLGEFILSFYPDFSSKLFTEENTFKALKLNKAFSKHELTRYLSKLFSVLEDFIAVEGILDFPLFKQSLISDYYYAKDNKSAFDKTQKQIDKIVNKSKKEDSVALFYTYINKKNAHNFLARQHLFKESRDYIEEAITALNHYFFVQLMMTSVGVQNIFQEPPNEHIFPLLPPVLEYISSHLEEVPLLAKMYYLVYRLKEQPTSQSAYNHLKNELIVNLKSLPPIHARTFMIMMNNALTRQASLGRRRYLEERFESYKIEIREGWIHAGNVMEYSVFNNIITTSLALGQLDFASTFIREHKRYIAEKDRTDTLQYNQARIAFHQGDIGTCLELCLRTAYVNPRIALSIKRYQIMSFFELGEEEQLYNSINSMKVYVHRLPESMAVHKKRNNAFLKAVTTLSKQPGQALRPQDRATLEGLLKEEPFMPEAEWIIEKMERA